MTEEQLREYVETMLKVKQFNVVDVKILTEGCDVPTLFPCVLMNGADYFVPIRLSPEVLDDPEEIVRVIVGAFTRRAIQMVSEGSNEMNAEQKKVIEDVPPWSCYAATDHMYENHFLLFKILSTFTRFEKGDSFTFTNTSTEAVPNANNVGTGVMFGPIHLRPGPDEVWTVTCLGEAYWWNPWVVQEWSVVGSVSGVLPNISVVGRE